ncbi:MAG: anaerobic ribonucleoside-triphosphate reductase [Bacilli bacterium]
MLFACEKGCEHMAQNPFFSVCENGHHNIGKLESCPECGAGITDFMTRTIGYFAYVSNMNYVRRTHEVPNRIAYNKKDI